MNRHICSWNRIILIILGKDEILQLTSKSKVLFVCQCLLGNSILFYFFNNLDGIVPHEIWRIQEKKHWQTRMAFNNEGWIWGEYYTRNTYITKNYHSRGFDGRKQIINKHKQIDDFCLCELWLHVDESCNHKNIMLMSHDIPLLFVSKNRSG